ncbi:MULTISPECIES: signal peptidase I [Enterococcus]|uniref:Signal peptidase I n=1 Tax=Enterococcus thailandicus TaxID=417368 RepID=A0A179EUK9_ENTTH|nr:MULTISPECIES: signal peptidase I [Enterococcus]ASZ08020.1 signal peptidase I [Enterococcus thailandicus]MDA3964190.1 signal peptidase I [Enterococcus thailandicus]MDK4352964.1 signal peptidase I [Enterococcus thailandicus]MDT2734202.1 signal peptidase I [Enterococcus thailandicus]MDT2752294.1 signal peptidase I [Enterococcus thailandicus]
MPFNKKITLIGSIVLILFLAIILCIVLLPHLLGLTPQIVTDKDMAPLYSNGSVVYVRPQKAEDILVGDVITYYENSGERVKTRRVVAAGENQEYFYTKADTQTQVESGMIKPRSVIGKPVFQIPYVGALLAKDSFSKMNILFWGMAFCLTAVTTWNTVDEFRKKKNCRMI